MPVLTYSCRNCGSALRFNAQEQDWTCGSCGSVFLKGDLETGEEVKQPASREGPGGEVQQPVSREGPGGEVQQPVSREGDRQPRPRGQEGQASQGQGELGSRPEWDQEAWEGVEEGDPDISVLSDADEQEFVSQINTYSCPGCGAEIITEETTAATFCVYCHSPTIIPQQLSGIYKPSKIIPFTYEKREVVDRFLGWCKKKPLLPDNFKDESQVEKLTGIYIPFWLYECNVNGKIDASANKVRTWRSGDTRYTETKTYHVFREIRALFGGVPADGSLKADDKLMETIEPYDYSQVRPFAMPYLAGFQAEKYDVDSEKAFPRIKERVKAYTDNLLRNSIKGYSSVSVKNTTVNFRDVKVEYALLPVWMLTYHFKGEQFFFVMNGQTSKIAGKLPLCRKKAAKYFLGITAATYAILLLGGMFI